MSDDIWARDEIESPCVKICVIHPAEGLCTGCHAWKTRQETIRGMNRWKMPAERHPGLL